MESKTFDSFAKSKKSINTKENIDPDLDLKSFVEDIYNKGKNSTERVDEIIIQLGLFFKYFNEDMFSRDERQTLIDGLNTLKDVEVKANFVSGAYKCLKILLDVSNKYPKEYEEASAHGSNESDNYIELNRLVSYEKDGESIYLHHSSAKTLGPDRKLYIDAMQKLAEIIKKDEEIKIIRATSWIVVKAPTLFTRSGFTVEKVDTKGNSFSSIRDFLLGQKPPEEIATASITREKFLARFLKED